jgi:hypothetical protein
MSKLSELFHVTAAGRRAGLVTAIVAGILGMASCNPKTIDAAPGQVVTLVEGQSGVETFVGDTALVIVSAYDGLNPDPDNPHGERIIGPRFTWTSSNPSVISLVDDQQSHETAAHFLTKSVGTATLTATLDDDRMSLAPGVSGTVQIQAKVGERPTAVRLAPRDQTIRVGDNLVIKYSTITPSGNPTYTSNVVTQFYCYDQNIAADHNGSTDDQCGSPFAGTINLHALNPGTEKIKVIFDIYHLRYTDSTTVTVLPAISPTRVTVDPTSTSLVAGATRQLTATVYDQSNNVINGAAVQWLPSDVSVATVNAQGLLTGVSTNGADSAKIQVIARAATGVEATVAATVYRAVSTVVVSPDPMTIQVGSTHPFAYQLKATNGNVIPLNATSVKWSTRDPSIATVDQAGIVSGVSAGTTKVVVTTAEGVAGSADLTVEAIPPAPVVKVVVSPSTASPNLSDGFFQFTAKAFDANGNEVVVTGFRWLVDDSNVGSVDGTGNVRLKNKGTTTVRAFYGNASDAPGGSASLTVN